MFIPHLPIHVTHIRVMDLTVLLVAGGVWELLLRGGLFWMQRPGPAFRAQQTQLRQLNANVKIKRESGPDSFVETSKLERQILKLEHQLQQDARQRQQRKQWYEKYLKKYGSMLLAVTVFVAYYGVPLVVFAGLDGDDDEFMKNSANHRPTSARRYFGSMLFPLSAVGIGVRISRWGLAPDVAHCSVGALLAWWAPQVLVGQLMDAFEAYVLL